MPESAATRILQTKVVSDGPNAAHVELTIADAATFEEATASIVLSMTIDAEEYATLSLAEIQRRAIENAANILGEIWRTPDKLLGHQS